MGIKHFKDYSVLLEDEMDYLAYLVDHLSKKGLFLYILNAIHVSGSHIAAIYYVLPVKLIIHEEDGSTKA